jgi:hypothetical protein
LRRGGVSHKQLIGDLFFLPLNGAAVIAAWCASRRCRAQPRLRSNES